MRLPLAVMLLALDFAGICRAGETDCSSQALARATQATMNICADRRAQASDKALDAAYRQLAGKLDDGGRATLKEAELAWIKYRDATCDFETSLLAGGSMRPMAISTCREDAGRARETELRRYLACQGKESCNIAFK